MILILSVIVMCSYLYSVCLVSRVLKNAYFKELISVVASKYSICDMENKTQEFKLCSMFKKDSSNSKGIGKGIMTSVESTLIIYSPNGKDVVL